MAQNYSEQNGRLEGDTSRAVDRALTILDVLSRSDVPLGTRELSRSLGFPLTATHRLLATLQHHGFVRQDSSSDKHTLGSKILELSTRFLESFDFRRMALPVMRDIREKCDETVSLFVMDGDSRVCVESLESRQSVRRVIPIGARLPLHVGATGKLFLAYLPTDQQDGVLQLSQEHFTGHIVTDVSLLRHELETIRQQGWASSAGERVDSTGSVSAPIWGSAPESIIAALTISTPIGRFTRERQDLLVALVREGAETISEMLGAGGGI